MRNHSGEPTRESTVKKKQSAGSSSRNPRRTDADRGSRNGDMTIRVLLMTALAVMGFGILSSTANAAEADGIARVSHTTAHPQYQAAPEYPYYVASGRGNYRQPPNPTYWTWMPLPFHGCCDQCGDANCPGQKGFWTFPFVRWVLDPDYYTVAPDYGWSPPAKIPVRRQNVTYQNYGPHAMAPGNGAGYTTQRHPIIATPTDTTQLGYYYKHVPTWQARNILPVPPHPRHWHTRPCQPDQNMSYVRWIRLQNAWVPLNNMPGAQAGSPTPVDPAMPGQDIPAPPEEDKPVPVIPMAPPNAPEALNVPEIADPIRRVSS